MSQIESSNSNTVVSGTSGNDVIHSRGSNVTVKGLGGNDSIKSDGYNNLIMGGDGNDTIRAGYPNKPDTIEGGKGNDYIHLGNSRYNVINYTYGDGNDTIVNFDLTDKIQITTDKDFSKYSSGNDYIIKFDTGSITVKNMGRYITSSNIVTISGGGDDDGGGSSEKNSWKLNGTTATYGTSSKTLATVKGAKSTNGLGTPADKKITLQKSALKNKVTVSGSYEFDFASGYKNATISGTKKNDTITARGSNLKIFGGKGKDSIKMIGTGQIVSGGAGADTFIYAASGGKERITDFSADDTLKIGANGDGTYSTLTSGSDVVVSTDDGGKITLSGAAETSLNIIGTKRNSGAGVKVSSNGKKITLTENYIDASFSLTGKYSSAITLNASAALLDLNLTGNNFSNRIIGSPQDDTIDGGKGKDTINGGEGSDKLYGNDVLIGGTDNDTLWGGEGSDKLYGNDGADVFYYKTGEGNDTIFGYEASVDKIILGSGKVSNVATDRNNNVIFTIGDGQIVVNNAADRIVKIVNPSGQIVSLYEP